MKCVRRIQWLLFLILMEPLSLLAEDSVDCHEFGDCIMDRQGGYALYSQFKSVSMSPNGTVEFNIVFYRQMDEYAGCLGMLIQ